MAFREWTVARSLFCGIGPDILASMEMAAYEVYTRSPEKTAKVWKLAVNWRALGREVALAVAASCGPERFGPVERVPPFWVAAQVGT